MKRKGSKLDGPDLYARGLRWETARANLLRQAGRHDEVAKAEQWCRWLQGQLQGELQGLITFEPEREAAA